VGVEAVCRLCDAIVVVAARALVQLCRARIISMLTHSFTRAGVGSHAARMMRLLPRA
jgi:hypothetical protein